jgi:hypothetical protein
MRINISSNPKNPTQTIEAEIDSIGLQRVDEAAAIARPAEIGTFYVEEEIQHRADEQPHQWKADGTLASRDAVSTVGELDKAVGNLETIINGQEAVTEASREAVVATRHAVGNHVRRAPKAAKLFYARLVTIFLGDIAGVASATILFGLIPWMAFLQALAIGGAAVTAGTAGAEFKDLQLARNREKAPEDLTDEERPFAHLFSGPKKAESYTKIGISVALTVVLLIFGGIFALQAATDSTMAGVLFGSLGAAVGLASFINYWTYTDDIADLLDTKEAIYNTELNRQRALCEAPIRLKHGRSAAEAKSIQDEHDQRGEAARLHILALGKKALRNNPGVVGHGRLVHTPTGPETALDASFSRGGELEQIVLTRPSANGTGGSEFKGER